MNLLFDAGKKSHSTLLLRCHYFGSQMFVDFGTIKIDIFRTISISIETTCLEDESFRRKKVRETERQTDRQTDRDSAAREREREKDIQRQHMCVRERER